jgi:hypothetical protein
MSIQQLADYSIFSDLLGISELGSHGTMVTKLAPGNMSCGVPYSCVAANCLRRSIIVHQTIGTASAQHHILGHISHSHPRNSTIYICPYLRDEQSHTTAVYGVHYTHMAQNTIGGSMMKQHCCRSQSTQSQHQKCVGTTTLVHLCYCSGTNAVRSTLCCWVQCSDMRSLHMNKT